MKDDPASKTHTTMRILRGEDADGLPERQEGHYGRFWAFTWGDRSEILKSDRIAYLDYTSWWLSRIG